MCLVSESASGRFAPTLEVFAYRSAHPVHCLQCHSNPLCCEPRSRASLPCCRPAGPSQAQALCSSYFWSAVKDFTFANGVVSLQGWVPALTHVDPGCSRRGLPPVRSASQEGEGLNLCPTGGPTPEWLSHRDSDTQEGHFERQGLNLPSQIHQSEERTLLPSKGITKDGLIS